MMLHLVTLFILVVNKFSCGFIVPQMNHEQPSDIASLVCATRIEDERFPNIKKFLSQYFQAWQPGSNSGGYTGFKIYKHFLFQFLPPLVDNSIKVTFCRDGVSQWTVTQNMQEDIDWNKFICIYDGKSNITSSLRTAAINDINNYHCFKLARRKKYVKRNYSFFLPGSFIGGLYYCNLSKNQKIQILDSSTSNLVVLHSNPMPLCNENNTIPLLPLVSDDLRGYWSYWYSKKSHNKVKEILNANVHKVVPYIHTYNFPSFEYNKTGSIPMFSVRELLFNLITANELGLNGLKNGIRSWFYEVSVTEDYSSFDTKPIILDVIINTVINVLGQAASTPHRALYKILKEK
ncbi:uncharacterized protein CGFF_03210 [Nakaseomyces glabratus]|nr:hypothetical protein J6894_02451 [Nakaseomyces glabratus]QNG14531.1 uncharacterized protein GWK60_H08877 [Nakaseomyces glabratus]SCV15653.1 uncharacterized protein CGFF_03210 [Nakaseomyces glabratus]SLM15032.1 uncharacterized protein CGFF_03210 [Nakaseomyces glabratus]